jgi:hypothetical protein
MAYDFVAASSQYLTIGSSSNLVFDKDDTFTTAGWWYIPSVATGAYQLLNKQQNSGNATGWALAYTHQLDIGGVNNYLNFSKRQSAANEAWATSIFTISSATWVHAAASTISADANDHNVYGNGALLSKTVFRNTLTSAITNAVVPQINGRNGANNLNSFQAAEVGIWNVALTAAEIASLAKGMTCDKVRPQSLVFYAPLIRNLQDVRGGLTITNNNTATVANHPRVYA